MAKQADRSKDGQGVRHDDLDQSMAAVTTNAEAYFNFLSILQKGYDEGKSRYPDVNTDDVLFDRLNFTGLSSPIRIMDFGGGTGEPLAAIFQRLAGSNKKCIISVEEPHKDSLEKYKMLIENTSNTCVDIAYQGPLENYFGKSVEDLMAVGAYPRRLQDRVLAIHSLYHVVHSFDRTLDPVKNLQQAVSAMYAILNPGGEMTIALAKDDLFSSAALNCFEVLSPNLVENFKKRIETFRSVIFNGGIVDTLNAMYPKFTATMCQAEVPVPLVLSSIDDIGAVVSLSCMNGVAKDNSPFDERILRVCTDFVSKSGSEFGVSIDSQGKGHFSLKCFYVTITKVGNE